MTSHSPGLPLLSVIVPFYNEMEVLPMCCRKLDDVLAKLDMRSEVIFVDDGSRDGGADYLLTHPLCHANTRVVKLSRNFGKEAAMSAGLDHARGDAVIILDADLQDPPELIPAMIARWREGYDVVLMKRRFRAGETAMKRLSAHLFYRLLQSICRFPIPEDVGDFRLMSRKCINALNQLGESNRYMKGLFAWVGMPTSVILYDRDARAAGTSKWNYFGLIRLALDGITSFTTAPLRLSMMAGVLAAGFGVLFGLWIVAKAILFGDPTQGYPSLVALISFLGGIQLMGLGIVGEYVGKTYIESKRRPVYVVDVHAESMSAELLSQDFPAHG